MPTAKRKLKVAPRSPHGTGIGVLVNELLRAGKTNEEVLRAVKVKFPKASTNAACVSWSRTKLRSGGEKIKTNRELSKKKAA
jgi:hypothetical protein